MATLIFGLVILALVLYALNAFTKVNPQTAAVVLKTGGGLGALAAAGLLGVRGRLDIAIPLGLTGLGLLGWLPWSIPGFAARTQKSAGQVSRVRSAFMEVEAYQILGVEPGASAEDIGRAHRALMKKLHPDQGGSTYLAARVNEAKEVLLRRHR